MDIKNVTFAYQDGIVRVKDVSFSIAKGKITTIIGPNGSGKSTLMSLLTNNNKPQSGHIYLEGKDLNEYRPKELAKTLAVVHQYNVAPRDMTVEKLVYYGRLPYKKMFQQDRSEDAEIVQWALKVTGLYERRHMLIENLSGGQQQRAWIAMALAQKTPYLLLDEPTSNLDIYYQYDILNLVKQLREEQGLTIVMVLHDINQAIQFSDAIIAMKDGEIVAQGDPKEIVTKELMQEVYGVDVVIKEDEDIGMYMVPLGV